MDSLKIIKRITRGFFVLICFTSCTSSSYRILSEDQSSIEIQVTPNRVILECERVETDDRGVVAGFMMHVIDETRTSFTLVQSNTIDTESCRRRVKKIEKILKNGNQIYLMGIGDFRKPRITGRRQHHFPEFGMIEDNGRSLQFIAVWNEHNQCYGAFSAEEKPCPLQ